MRSFLAAPLRLEICGHYRHTVRPTPLAFATVRFCVGDSTPAYRQFQDVIRQPESWHTVT